MKKIGIVCFDAYHQQKNTASSRIRGDWLLKYWPEAERFVQGKDYDVVIYQKVYWKEHARNFKGKKILDICDPDWMDGIPVKAIAEEIDAITVPTEALNEAISKFCKKPIYVVKDRIDLETLPAPKVDSGKKAEKAVWFGYAQNMDVLDPALMFLGEQGLKLIVVSNRSLASVECEVENVKWEVETANEEIQKADFAILPRPENGRSKFKSENKETLANALGLPVAKTADDVRRFMDPEERKKEMAEKYPFVMAEYDVKKSVEEMKKVIESITK